MSYTVSRISIAPCLQTTLGVTKLLSEHPDSETDRYPFAKEFVWTEEVPRIAIRLELDGVDEAWAEDALAERIGEVKDVRYSAIVRSKERVNRIVGQWGYGEHIDFTLDREDFSGPLTIQTYVEHPNAELAVGEGEPFTIGLKQDGHGELFEVVWANFETDEIKGVNGTEMHQIIYRLTGRPTLYINTSPTYGIPELSPGARRRMSHRIELAHMIAVERTLTIAMMQVTSYALGKLQEAIEESPESDFSAEIGEYLYRFLTNAVLSIKPGYTEEQIVALLSDTTQRNKLFNEDWPIAYQREKARIMAGRRTLPRALVHLATNGGTQ